ncbi:MAG: aminotransferase class III-fold pyridoxal phosphate-dependent enzyme, partial [Oxalobacteraceae bacterium]|nr:aminotransferase class III-fold pyridoxal phosphate-dependent enzyme [Oxalobacteraceae bacterium]
DKFIMDLIKPGDHGSTYGGNPLAMAVSKAAVSVIVEEGMVENSAKQGALLKKELQKLD